MEQLEKIQSLLHNELAEMNQIISQSLFTSNKLMNQVVESYLQKKGKQIRPILVMLSAKMFGQINEDVIHASAALEMLHNASLIHDDVVDETSLRRGIPTINFTWGNQIAVLVGDYFVSNALAAGIKTGHISIISALSALGKELSLGEIDQICNARNHHFDEESYLNMIGKKTASLFENCVKMGAEAVKAKPEDYSPLVEFARLLGLCFQIKDDIFDYFCDKRIGKPTGNDLREGKVSLPLLYALKSSSPEESEEMTKILINNDLTTEQIDILIEFAKRNGGIEYAYERMREMQQKAKEIIAHYPDSEAKEIFLKIFDYIISRYK